MLFIRRIIFFVPLVVIACSEAPVQKPVGALKQPDPLEISQQRARRLNIKERAQITDWIQQQDEKFYETPLNYWINIPHFNQRQPKPSGSKVVYSYDLYDFIPSKIYDKSIIKHAVIGKNTDLRAVAHAVKYLHHGEKATLLVPSVLAYGTFGDNKYIQNDVPLIIKIEMK